MADLARLVVRLEADSLKFQKELDQAKRKLSGFEKASDKSAKAVKDSFASMGKALAAGFTVNAFKNLIANSIQAGAEISRFAQLAGSSTSEFQKWGFAVASVGISHEKLADILKDVNDKIGDFMQTGAGPLADFFENIAPKVGVTVKQFQGLSGPQALGLYVKSLEKANVSQAEMTFFMEAIANDATLLAPLLKDGGKRMNELGSEAERLGLILSNETIAQFREFQNQLKVVGMLTTNIGQRIASEMIGPMSEMNGLLIDFGKDAGAAETIGKAFGVVIKGVAIAAIAVSSTLANLGRAIGGLAAAAAAAASGEFSQAGSIIDAFSAENEAAAKQAEERIAKLWSGAYEKAGMEAAAAAANAGAGAGSAFNKSLLDAEKKAAAAAAAARKKAAAEQASATSSIAGMVQSLQQESATFGLDESAVIRYRIAQGDLAATFAAAGAGAAQYKDQLIALTDGLEAQRAASELAAQKQEVFSNDIAAFQAELSETMSPLKAYEQTIAFINGLLEKGALTQKQYAEEVTKAGDAFANAKPQADDWAKTVDSVFENAAQSMQSSLADFLFDPFADGLDGMLNGFVTMLRRMGAELLAAEAFKMLSSSFGGMSGGGTGGIIAGIAGMFGGARANGGPVSGGTPYLVGERGPELMVPGSSGNIMNTRETSGLGGTNVTMNVSTPDADSFRKSRRQVVNGVKIGFGV